MVLKPDTFLLTWVSNEVLSAIDFDVRIGNLTLEAQRGTGKHLPLDVFFFFVLLGANKINHWARFHGRLQRHDAACPECLGGTWRYSVSRRLPVDRSLFNFCKLMLDGRSFGRIG